MSNEISKGILQAVGVIAGVLLLGWFLYKVQSVLAYLFLSFVVTLVGRPIVLFLRNRLRFRNLWAVITTMLIIFGLFFSLLLLFIPLVKQQGHNLSLLNMESLRASSQRLYTEAIAYFSGDNAEVEKTLLEAPWFENFDFSSLSNFVNELFSILGSFSIGLFSVIFISFFLLKDSRLMESSLLSLVSDSKTESVSRSFLKIKNLLSRYFIGLIFQVLVLFIIYSSVLLIFGIDNAIVIAFLCALLNIIPYLGPIIGGVLMLFLSMSSNLGADFSTVILPTSLYVMIGFAVGQLIDNFFSQPIIYSSSVKSHPLEIFLVIIISGLLFGIVGMVVAIPVYTMLKAVAQEFLPDVKVVQKLTKNF